MATIFWGLVLLGVLILVHELGHFLFAKWAKVRVPTFSIGFGPKILSIRRGETEYAISAVPLGGYVKLAGMNGEQDLSPVVLGVQNGSAARAAGLKAGDVVTAVAGHKIMSLQTACDAVDLVRIADFEIEVEREGRTLTLKVQPEASHPESVNDPRPEVLAAAEGKYKSFPEIGLRVGIDQPTLDGAFYNKPLYKRFLIILAGPAFSLLFPVLVYFLVNLATAERTAAFIGEVFPGSPAAAAGLLPGDVITEIDGRKVSAWEDVLGCIHDRAGELLNVKIIRDGQSMGFSITPQAKDAKNDLGEAIKQGRIGIVSAVPRPVIGIEDPESPAGKAGLKTGDLVTAVNGEKIARRFELERQLAEMAVSGRTVVLSVKTGDEAPRDVKIVPAPLNAPAKAEGVPGETAAAPEAVAGARLPDVAGLSGEPSAAAFYTGIHPGDLILGKVDPESPAAEAGLKAGDRLVSLDGTPIVSWYAFSILLEDLKDKDESFKIVASREGKADVFSMKLVKQVLTDKYGNEQEIRRPGISPAVEYWNIIDEVTTPVENRFTYALWSSVTQSARLLINQIIILQKLFSGDLSWKSVGGPIMIIDIAGQAAQAGMGHFLKLMGIISLNLGVINLLPIPVLDGGHLMFYTLEALMRRPVNRKVREYATMAGLVILLCLMVFVLGSDFYRYVFGHKG